MQQTDNRSRTGIEFVHIFFMDGVGLGGDDPQVNPFVTARMPALTGLLGPDWFLAGRGRITTERLTLIPTDACLSMPGKPQSATGQATLLTGLNVPRMIGQHFGPKPNEAIADIIRRGNLFQQVTAAGGAAALLTPYPQRYFDAIQSGHRLYSAVPLAATSAGIPLMTVDDLRAGRAVSPDFTGQAWRDFLGYDDIPLLSLAAAGECIASLASDYAFSFFEHWPSDNSGHRGTLNEAVQHLEVLDMVLGGLINAWDDQAGLLIITSDHGNIEEKSHSRHTMNPVPTILVGPKHVEWAAMVHDLSDIAGVVRTALGI